MPTGRTVCLPPPLKFLAIPPLPVMHRKNTHRDFRKAIQHRLSEERQLSATWPSGTVPRLLILCRGFDSRLEQIVFQEFDIYTGWLLPERKLTLQFLSVTVEFSVQNKLENNLA